LEEESLVQRVGWFIRPLYCEEIILLDFSRNPAAFYLALQNCTALRNCQEALKMFGMSVELEKGAQLFVRPEMFDAAKAAINRAAWDLKRSHVVVAKALESEVMHAVRSLPSSAQVKLKKRLTSSLQAAGSSEEDHEKGETNDAEAAKQDDEQVQLQMSRLTSMYVVHNTFIHVPVAESLYSGPSSSQKTKSTTDANPRVSLRRRPRQV
jgi:hypothetical protein